MTNKKNRTGFPFPLSAILFSIAVSFFSCKQKKTEATVTSRVDSVINPGIVYNGEIINNARKLLKDGQLVTRSDDDFESLILQNFSRRERTYSHSGIVFKEGNDYIVYHCMGGEENPGEACQKDPFDSFVNPLKKTGFGIFQYQLSTTESEKLHNILESYYSRKIPFDESFDLKTNDSLYCSEMIYKSLKEATANRIILPSSYIENFKPKIMGYKKNNLFFKKFEFIGIDDLYMNPFCKEITRIKYK